MSGYPGGGHYDDGYGHPHGDSYYQDDHGQGYYDPNDYGDGYYDRSYVYPCVYGLDSGIDISIFFSVDIIRPMHMAPKLDTTMGDTLTSITVTRTTMAMATRAMAVVAMVDDAVIPRMSPKRSVISP